MGSLAAPEEAFGEGTSRPQIVSLSALFNKPFSWGSQYLRYSASWRGQWNDTPLVAQDRFIIGTRYTVRGFEDGNILLGERGWFLRNDIALIKGQIAQEFYLGLDYGEVGGAGSNARSSQHLAGVAVGVRGALKQVAFDLVLSRPLSAPQGFDTSTTRFSFSLNASY
jgi:hemolysin activation/secretion protein